MLSESPRLPVLVTDCLYVGGSYDPFLRLITCHNLSQNSGERFTYHYQFIIKETNGEPDEEVPREGMEGSWARRILDSVPVELECTTPMKMSTDPEAPKSCHLGIFMEAPLCSTRIKLLAIGDLTQSPLLLSLWRSGGGAESSKLLSKAWSSWQPVLFSKLSRRCRLISTERRSYHWGNSKGFKTLCQDLGKRPNTYFLLYHNIIMIKAHN